MGEKPHDRLLYRWQRELIGGKPVDSVYVLWAQPTDLIVVRASNGLAGSNRGKEEPKDVLIPNAPGSVAIGNLVQHVDRCAELLVDLSLRARSCVRRR